MIYLAVDKNGDELLSCVKLKRSHDNVDWVADMRYCHPGEDIITVLPHGFIKRVLGHVLTWNDDPVEVDDPVDDHDMSKSDIVNDKYKIFNFENISNGKRAYENLENELNRIHHLGYEVIDVQRYFLGDKLTWDIITKKI